MAAMDAASLVEILSERFIKPSTPTPSSSTFHKLSSKEQVINHRYLPWAFFYPFGDHLTSKSIAEISQLLVTSLSKTLTYYYPFAGRLNNNLFVDCNDAGIPFTEARIKCSLSEALNPPNSPLKDLVFHTCLSSSTPPKDGSILFVQVSYFNCGGVAVAICISHKVSDASTICTLTNDWAAVARHSSYVPTPKFNGASIFPPVDLDRDASFKELTANSPPRAKCITKRFLIQASKLAQLKADSGVDHHPHHPHPTRVEVVTALLYRCAMAARRANMGSIFRPSVLLNAVNLRSLTVPPLPQDSIGSFITFFPISTSNEDETNLSDLVRGFRTAKVKLQNGYKDYEVNAYNEFELSLRAAREIESCDVYCSSSWCRFPIYEVDFGWGQPLMVCTTNECVTKNLFILMDTKEGDAIEAAVTLEESDMALFQQNAELLAFASLVG